MLDIVRRVIAFISATRYSGVDCSDLIPTHIFIDFFTNSKGRTVSHKAHNEYKTMYSNQGGLEQCFSTAGPRPGTGPWHQLYRAATGFPGICHFSFL